MKKITEIISKKYSKLNELTIKDWNSKSRIIELKKGDILVKEGQYKQKLFFVVKGSIIASYIFNEKKIVDWFTFKNEFITSSTSYFDKAFKPSLHSLEAMEDCIILETDREMVELLCEKHHDFEHLVRLILSKVIIQFRRRIVSIQFKTVKERYNSLLMQYPQIELTVPLGDIASFLGISQESLSRIRASK